MNKALALAGFSLSLFLVASPALAATFSAGQPYTLDKQTTIDDDLYAAASSPIISGTVLGDAMLAGGSITFDGTAKNNLMAAGGTITILGSVGSSARAVGGTITMTGPIGADAVAAGGTITLLQSATVGRDVALAGGDITIGGTVGRNVTVRGGSVTINGTVNGNVDVQVSQKLILGERAIIKGTLTYSAPAEMTKAPGATIAGTVSYKPTAPPRDFNPAGVFAALVGIIFVIKFLAYGAAVVLATTLFKRTSGSIALSTLEDFWKNLSIGFIALIIVPIACLVLLISILGSAIAFLALCAYLVLIIAAKVLSAIVAGAVLSKWFRKEPTVNWKWALLGLFVVQFVSVVPLIGWLAGAVLFLAALGALATLTYYAVADAR